MQVEKGDITRQLEEAVPGARYKLKLNHSLPVRVSIRATDNTVAVQVNPKRIRSDGQLQDVISLIAEELERSAPRAKNGTTEERSEDNDRRKDVPTTDGRSNDRNLENLQGRRPNRHRGTSNVPARRVPTVVAVQRGCGHRGTPQQRSHRGLVGSPRRQVTTGQAALF